MNYICNETGIDTMDAGSTISAVMELFEMGRITEKEIGFPLTWGDADGAIRLLNMIASAEGFGDQPAVINGASDFLVEVFGEQGRHARLALGAFELPLHASIELELIVQVSSGQGAS